MCPLSRCSGIQSAKSNIKCTSWFKTYDINWYQFWHPTFIISPVINYYNISNLPTYCHWSMKYYDALVITPCYDIDSSMAIDVKMAPSVSDSLGSITKHCYSTLIACTEFTNMIQCFSCIHWAATLTYSFTGVLTTDGWVWKQDINKRHSPGETAAVGITAWWFCILTGLTTMIKPWCWAMKWGFKRMPLSTN